MNDNIFLLNWRLEKGLTQGALADRSGLTQAQISRLEISGQRPTYRTIQRLAKALGIKPEELFNPPPGFCIDLSRYEMDKVAKAVVSGRRNMNRSLNRLADDIARLALHKLRAFRAPGRFLAAKRRWNTKFVSLKINHLYHPGILNQILARIDKTLL